MNKLLAQLARLRKMRLLAIVLGAFGVSLGGSITSGVPLKKALLLSGAAALVAGGSFLQNPTHDHDGDQEQPPPG